jgi:hypothetical protein
MAVREAASRQVQFNIGTPGTVAVCRDEGQAFRCPHLEILASNNKS